MKGKAALALLAPSGASKKYAPGGGTGKPKSTKTSTEVRSPTETSTSTDAYTKGNVTVTGGAGSGDTHVTIDGKNGDEKDEPMDDDDKEGGDYAKVMLSAAKDILDAEDPKALKAALYDFVCAAMAQEDSGDEE